MKKFIVLFFIFLFLALGNCKKNPAEPASSKEIFPLAVGNRWIYNQYLFYESGYRSWYKYDTVEVCGERNSLGIKYYNVLYYEYDKIDNTGGWIDDYANQPGGLYIHVDPQFFPGGGTLIYKYPGQPGNFYLSNFGICTIDSINAQVILPIGNFKCFKYIYDRTDERGDLTREIHYCSLGIGLIKKEIYYAFSDNNDSIKIQNSQELNFYIIK